MRIIVCVKWVPALGSLRFDPETRRLVREGVPGEVSSFDLRALGAAVALRAAHDLVLFGRASTDAETGQVGPEVAEMLDLPQVTAARRLELDPAARTFVAERETDEGFETVTGPLPAVVTAAEDIAEERFPTKAERQAAAAKPIASLGAAEVGLAPDDVGARGSPTWVAGIEHVPSARRGARRPSRPSCSPRPRSWPRASARPSRR